MAEQEPSTSADRLGHAIHLRRVELNLKRPELARRAELSYPYVSEIENGMKTPSTKALRQLAGALEMSPSDLIALADRLEDSGGAETGSILAEQHPAERTVPGLLPARQVHSDELHNRETQIVIAAIVRAELAAWARTELPTLVRTALERALRERGK